MRRVLVFLAIVMIGGFQTVFAQSVASTAPQNMPGDNTSLSPIQPNVEAAIQKYSTPPGGMTPEQYEALQDEAEKKWESMTPEEKAKMREQLVEQWKSLDPQTKAEINAAIREKFKELTPAQRQEIVHQMRTYYNSLSPEEKAAIAKEQQLDNRPLRPIESP